MKNKIIFCLNFLLSNNIHIYSLELIKKIEYYIFILTSKKSPILKLAIFKVLFS
jgi:hypothetical protein